MTIAVSASQSSGGSPSKLFPARKLGEFALQKINAYSVNDTGADPAELDRAMDWMEINIAQLAGSGACWWLTKFDLTFTLEANVASFDLHDAFQTEVPSQRVLFPIAAYLITTGDDGSVTEEEIEIVRSSNFFQENDRDATGTPEMLFIDRANDEQTAWPWPIPTVGTFQIRLHLQTYAKSVLVEDGAGDTAHGFSQEWQRWLVHATAADIGDGPVRKVPKADILDWRREATSARAALEAFSNKEKRSGPPRTEAWGA